MARYPIEVAFETRTVQLLVDEERAHAIVFVDAVPVGRARIATGAQGLDLDAPARARLLARHLDPRRVARETADRVWVETRARAALAAAVDAPDRESARELMSAAAATYAVEAAIPGEEGARAARVRDRILELALRFA
ncbi:MAG: hypothetical protein U0234_14070 [Sandaracinus sp.]